MSLGSRSLATAASHADPAAQVLVVDTQHRYAFHLTSYVIVCITRTAACLPCVQSGVNLASSGTTASVAFQRGNRLWVASAGDSRAILCTRNSRDQWRALPLTIDHRPRRNSERERYVFSGVFVAGVAASLLVVRVWCEGCRTVLAAAVRVWHAVGTCAYCVVLCCFAGLRPPALALRPSACPQAGLWVSPGYGCRMLEVQACCCPGGRGDTVGTEPTCCTWQRQGGWGMLAVALQGCSLIRHRDATTAKLAHLPAG